MSKPISAECFVRDILGSDEYREGLKGRLLDGTAKVAELELAKRLGLAAEADPEDDKRRESMRAMPKFMRSIMLRLIRASNGSAPMPACREITGPGGTCGLVFESAYETGAGARTADQIQQDTQEDTEPMADQADLLPKAWART